MKIYFVPFLLDFILFLVQFRLADAAGREMRLSNAQATGLLVAFNFAYLLVCPFVGRALNTRNTRPILLFSIAAILALGVPLLWTTTFLVALVLMSGLGASSALAFNSFQAFMRGRTPVGALSKTVAKYNVSWALGIGLGFLLSGILKTLGQPLWLSLFCGMAVALVFAMIWSEKHSVSSTRIEGEQDVLHSFGDARYVAIGWSLCLAANFVQRPLAAFLPKFSAQSGNSAWMAGALLCALLWAQALSNFVIYKKPQWLYQTRPLIVFQVGVMTVLGCLWMTNNYVLSLILMTILGVLHGFAFFCSVFYCSNSERSAHNVGINEMAVGVGNVGGLILCNAALDWFKNERAFYPAIIVFSLLLLGAQLFWLRKSRAEVAKNVVASS